MAPGHLAHAAVVSHSRPTRAPGALVLVPPLLALAASLFGGNALACSIWIPPPGERLKQSQAVVLAVPKTISFHPEEASERSYSGPFRQTILWEVLISWKGAYKRGGTFTTNRSFGGDYRCGAASPIRFREVRILYLQGREPYSTFSSTIASDAEYDFRYLESRGRQ